MVALAISLDNIFVHLIAFYIILLAGILWLPKGPNIGCYLYVKQFSRNSLATSLLNWKSSHQTCSRDWIVLEVPLVSTELGKIAFSYCARSAWNDMQPTLRLDSVVSKGQVGTFMRNVVKEKCTCFDWCVILSAAFEFDWLKCEIVNWLCCFDSDYVDLLFPGQPSKWG